MIKKIKTGVSIFDDLCNGGLNKDSFNLVVGGAGSGKTIFCIQFLMEGLKKGETCMYITFEENKEILYKNMLELGFDLEKYEKTNKFIFVEYSPDKVRTMIDEGGGTLHSLIYKNKINRLVIDSITSFSLLFESCISQRRNILSLFDMIRKWNCSTLMTMQKELKKEELVYGSESDLEFEVDGVILLFFLRIKDERERFIEILKMRGTEHSKFAYPFTIKNKGIEIYRNHFAFKTGSLNVG